MSGSRQKRSEGRREQTNKSNAVTELSDYSTRCGIDTINGTRCAMHCAINGIFRVTSCMST